MQIANPFLGVTLPRPVSPRVNRQAVAPQFAAKANQPPPVPPNLEWLEVGARGSYSASTIGLANTRRYHGLYVANGKVPTHRKVLISRFDESIVLSDGSTTSLTNQVFDKQDANRLKVSPPLLGKFSPYPIPTWFFNLPEGKGCMQKQLVFHKDQSILVIGYTLSPEATEPVELKIKPFVNDRDIHTLNTREWNWEATPNNKGVTLRSSEGSLVFFQWRSSRTDEPYMNFQRDANWYRNYFYQREADRGLDSLEHNYTPGELTIRLRPGETINLTVSDSSLTEGGHDINLLANERAHRLKELMEKSGLPQTMENKLLVRAADQFMVYHGFEKHPMLLAGYHWFNQRSRDAITALPGVALSLGRLKESEQVLGTITKHLKNGMLPSRVPEPITFFPELTETTPEYEAIDISLWWMNTMNAYRKTLEEARLDLNSYKASCIFLKSQYDGMRQVFRHHLYGLHSGEALLRENPALVGIVDPQQGTLPVGETDETGQGRYRIGMAPDGLIHTDSPHLTWMDVQAQDGPNGPFQPVTPRNGKPVEINALWYNGLKSMAEVARFLQSAQRQHNPGNLTGDGIMEQERRLAYDIGQMESLAALVKGSMQKYWDEERQSLRDLLDSSYPEAETQMRPNQILAVGLSHRPFSPEQERAIVKTVYDKLWTPFGLRSLAADDPAYKGFYPISGPRERDLAYHQGTVWSWMAGPFLEAFLNVNGHTSAARKQVVKMMKPMMDHLQGHVAEHRDSGAVVGSISEIFDGNAPHYSKGGVAQAWSVGEILRQQINLARSEASEIPRRTL
jgi:glycogen debranching enzyme